MLEGSIAFRNANIRTMNPLYPRADALAIGGGRIVALGTWEEVAPHCQGAQVVDAEGKTILAGFIDTHVHFLLTAMGLTALDVSATVSFAEIGEQVQGAAACSPEGELILGMGAKCEWVLRTGAGDQMSSAEESLSPRQVLDAVAPWQRVLIIGDTGHFSLANSRCLNFLNLPEDGEGIQRDAGGQPSGILVGSAHEKAFTTLAREFASGPDTWRAIPRAVQQAASVGLTTIHALEGGDMCTDETLQAFLGLIPSLPLRFLFWYQAMEVSKVLQWGLPRIGGCILLDGDFLPRTAAVREPYSDGSGSGVLYHSQEEINAFVLEAHRAGLQVAMHAIGDRAIEQAITAYELALANYPRPDHRHRIEHAELITADQVERAKRLGLALAIQPAFNSVWAHTSHYDYLGEERALRADPIRTLLDAGLLVAGGSDSFVTPLWPLLGIHSAVNHSNPTERIDLQRAIEMFTINAARIGFEEKDKGSLEVGKLGDLVVLSEDPFQVDPTRLKDIKVERTVVGGKTVYVA
jgi:predicted amidohydrolase YtcJ